MGRPPVVVTHWVHPEVRAGLERFAEVRGPHEPGTVWDRGTVLAAAVDAHAVITSMADAVDEEFLDACPRLRIVAATLKGWDSYDAAACTRRGVWLTTVPDTIVAPTAELAVALTLALLRNVRAGDEIVRSGRFTGWRPQLYGTGLRGATVGIAGMGELGRAVAGMLDAFGVAELLHTDARPVDPGAAAPSRRVDLPTLVAGSDVVVLTLPLTADTHHLVDGAVLAHATGTHLVNVGRGSVVDEQAVLAALDDGRLAGYAADVFAMEDWSLPGRPAQVPDALRRHPRTVFTPHLGSAVDGVRRTMSTTAARQVEQVLRGERPEHAVNDPGRPA